MFNRFGLKSFTLLVAIEAKPSSYSVCCRISVSSIGARLLQIQGEKVFEVFFINFALGGSLVLFKYLLGAVVSLLGLICFLLRSFFRGSCFKHTFPLYLSSSPGEHLWFSLKVESSSQQQQQQQHQHQHQHHTTTNV